MGKRDICRLASSFQQAEHVGISVVIKMTRSDLKILRKMEIFEN